MGCFFCLICMFLYTEYGKERGFKESRSKVPGDGQEMRKNIAIYYSTITGNTLKLAKYIEELLRDKGYEVRLERSSEAESYTAGSADATGAVDVAGLADATDIADAADIVDASPCIIAFWCRLSALDNISLSFLDRCSGRKILAIGTMGGDTGGEYGERVEANVRAAVEGNNTCLGVYLCQGSVDLERLRKRLYLPEDNPHYVSPEKFQRHVDMQGHPDESDLVAAGEAVLKMLGY